MLSLQNTSSYRDADKNRKFTPYHRRMKYIAQLIAVELTTRDIIK